MYVTICNENKEILMSIFITEFDVANNYFGWSNQV